MMNTCISLIRRARVLLVVAWLMNHWAVPGNADDPDTFFENRIRPLLIERCYECHGDSKQEGGLRLDWRGGWQSGGEHGPTIVPGDVDGSLLIQAVRYVDPNLQMPPSRKLTGQQIADLEQWVATGASDPRMDAPHSRGGLKAGAASDLWSLQPIVAVPPPDCIGSDGSPNSIDAFVHAELNDAGLRPSPRADRRTLIRRATLDLTGLIPSMSEVEDFERAPSDDAYEQLIDRLLASPHYGEQWARHWLDVARYSDTKGYVYAREEKRWVHASAYRDWVVDAFNRDLPYDEFLTLQIAADQLVASDSSDLAAMGYLTIGRRFLGVTHDIIDDRIDAVTRGMLGLTVACARCHDHKFDPISTRDYYALYGVFQSSAVSVVPLPSVRDEAFETELAARQKNLRETMTKRRDEQSARVREAIDLYLLAQLELDKYPDEVFNQVIETTDLNPIVVRKWQSYLLSDTQRSDSIFRHWHELIDRRDRDGLHAEAERLSKLFIDIDQRWKELLLYDPKATSLPSAEDERIRNVMYALDSPCVVPDEHIANNEMFFPTNVIDELWKLQNEVDRWQLEGSGRARVATLLVDRPIPTTPRVLLRGNPVTKGAEVPRRFLTALGGTDERPFAHGSGRLELANAIANPTNPLTARVIVNRIWMHHFGRGLVPTPSDYGYRADKPSHPELLDWLAKSLIDSGWSLKRLQRSILLSETYRQQSLAQPGTDVESQRSSDPTNRWLSRRESHRLSFEEARDAWLAASNSLDVALHGRPIPLFAPRNARRTLYAYVDREQLTPVMRMFDFANPDLSIAQRNETTVPQQALFAMNHPFLAQQAIRIAMEFDSLGPTERIQALYARLFQRPPTPEEVERALRYVASDEPTSASPLNAPSEVAEPAKRLTSWQQWIQVLLCSNEFMFVD